MKLGVIGKGIVGSAVYQGLESIGNTMSFFDVAYQDSNIFDIFDTEIVFVCVPTEMTIDGDCDISIVEDVVQNLAEIGYRGLIAIKSTITPGTTLRLQNEFPSINICCVPEFLRSDSAFDDFFKNHDVLIVGTNSVEHHELVVASHGSIPKTSIMVNPSEAEISKYFNNVHHAVQITFANITYEVCKKLGANYDNVHAAITLRECINPHYLKANESLRGFGGKCLPKDIVAWKNLINKLNLNFQLIEAAINDNEKFK